MDLSDMSLMRNLNEDTYRSYLDYISSDALLPYVKEKDTWQMAMENDDVDLLEVLLYLARKNTIWDTDIDHDKMIMYYLGSPAHILTVLEDNDSKRCYDLLIRDPLFGPRLQDILTDSYFMEKGISLSGDDIDIMRDTIGNLIPEYTKYVLQEAMNIGEDALVTVLDVMREEHTHIDADTIDLLEQWHGDDPDLMNILLSYPDK